ncbi:MAG: ATP-binding cassette domain-containing protein, partial [Bryobacteraceae bacterium]|nr:ATP-binding cassette domain-containing protein [Bryobacteraceae bacterium]
MIQARIHKTFAARPDSSPFRLALEFEARKGITVLFGPSGAGKSLTLDCIAGFAEPDSGRILIDDEIVFDSGTKVSIRPQERRCGYVFQTYALFPHMSVRANLEFAAASLPRLDRQRRVSELLDRFRLTEVAGRLSHQISGGQKQRCSIARALAASPRILLLDEPAQGLDAPLRAEFHDILRHVRDEDQTPVILVTHNLTDSLELGDCMLVIHDGSIAQQGPPALVCSQPANLDLARILGSFNILPVEIRALDPSKNTSVLRW